MALHYKIVKRLKDNLIKYETILNYQENNIKTDFKKIESEGYKLENNFYYNVIDNSKNLITEEIALKTDNVILQILTRACNGYNYYLKKYNEIVTKLDEDHQLI